MYVNTRRRRHDDGVYIHGEKRTLGRKPLALSPYSMFLISLPVSGLTAEHT